MIGVRDSKPRRVSFPDLSPSKSTRELEKSGVKRKPVDLRGYGGIPEIKRINLKGVEIQRKNEQRLWRRQGSNTNYLPEEEQEECRREKQRIVHGPVKPKKFVKPNKEKQIMEANNKRLLEFAAKIYAPQPSTMSTEDEMESVSKEAEESGEKKERMETEEESEERARLRLLVFGPPAPGTRREGMSQNDVQPATAPSDGNSASNDIADEESDDEPMMPPRSPLDPIELAKLRKRAFATKSLKEIMQDEELEQKKMEEEARERERMENKAIYEEEERKRKEEEEIRKMKEEKLMEKKRVKYEENYEKTWQNRILRKVGGKKYALMKEEEEARAMDESRFALRIGYDLPVTTRYPMTEQENKELLDPNLGGIPLRKKSMPPVQPTRAVEPKSPVEPIDSTNELDERDQPLPVQPTPQRSHVYPPTVPKPLPVTPHHQQRPIKQEPMDEEEVLSADRPFSQFLNKCAVEPIGIKSELDEQDQPLPVQPAPQRSHVYPPSVPNPTSARHEQVPLERPCTSSSRHRISFRLIPVDIKSSLPVRHRPLHWKEWHRGDPRLRNRDQTISPPLPPLSAAPHLNGADFPAEGPAQRPESHVLLPPRRSSVSLPYQAVVLTYLDDREPVPQVFPVQTPPIQRQMPVDHAPSPPLSNHRPFVNRIIPSIPFHLQIPTLAPQNPLGADPVLHHYGASKDEPSPHQSPLPDTPLSPPLPTPSPTGHQDVLSAMLAPLADSREEEASEEAKRFFDNLLQKSRLKKWEQPDHPAQDEQEEVTDQKGDVDLRLEYGHLRALSSNEASVDKATAKSVVQSSTARGDAFVRGASRRGESRGDEERSVYSISPVDRSSDHAETSSSYETYEQERLSIGGSPDEAAEVDQSPSGSSDSSSYRGRIDQRFPKDQDYRSISHSLKPRDYRSMGGLSEATTHYSTEPFGSASGREMDWRGRGDEGSRSLRDSPSRKRARASPHKQTAISRSESQGEGSRLHSPVDRQRCHRNSPMDHYRSERRRDRSGCQERKERRRSRSPSRHKDFANCSTLPQMKNPVARSISKSAFGKLSVFASDVYEDGRMSYFPTHIPLEALSLVDLPDNDSSSTGSMPSINDKEDIDGSPIAPTKEEEERLKEEKQQELLRRMHNSRRQNLQ